MLLKQLKNLISFLTIIPVGMDLDYLIDAANYMYLFPLIGAFIGLLGGLFAYVLLTILPPLIVGILTAGTILLITGLHHTDGLLDFGDGIMFQGSAEKRIEIMHDSQTGTGGMVLGLMVILTTALGISQFHQNLIIQTLLTSEVSAKLTMVIMAWLGKSAHEGMNTYFVNAMHGQNRNWRLIIALFISFSVAIPLLGAAGLITMIGSIAIALFLVVISNRLFKGITGDVFGAGNEFTRATSLIVILVVIKWV